MQNEQSKAMQEFGAGIDQEISSILGDNQNGMTGTNEDVAVSAPLSGFFEGLSERTIRFIDQNPYLIEVLSERSEYCG